VGIAHEDKRRDGLDRAATTNDTSASLTGRDPARSDTCRGAFDDVPPTVDASDAKTAAVGVERPFAVELDAPVRDHIERLGSFETS
jgi:hypothetical protein